METSRYDAKAVQHQINRENSRHGKGYISRREARAIHALLRGHDRTEARATAAFLNASFGER